MERRRRTLAKTVTFRILATLTTILIVFFLTKDFALAGVAGVIEFASKIVLYYGHERVWSKINWGLTN